MNENEQLPEVRATKPADAPTDRSLERFAEDRTWVPVIVKRTDEARRHPDDVLMATIDEGLEQLLRPTLSLGLSAVVARFLSLALLGNVIGGSFFVAALNYAHIRKSRERWGARPGVAAPIRHARAMFR